MRFGDIKIVLIDFYSYEISAIEAYLEKMALKGWKLEKLSKLYIKFKKTEPKSIKYTIDVIDGITAYGERDSDVALEYREKLGNKGWNFSCEYNNLQIFYKENATEKSYICNKGIREKRLLFKDSLGNIIAKLLLIGLYIYTNYLSIAKGRTLEFLSNNKNLVMSVIFIGVFIVSIIDLLRLIKFRIRVTYKDENKNIYWIRFKGISFFVILLLAILVFIALLLTSRTENSNLTISIMAIIISVLLFSYLLGNKKDNTKKKITISSTFIILITTIFIINNFFIANIFKNKSMAEKGKEYALGLKDFNDEAITEEDIYIDEESSFIANKIFYTANGKKMKLSYELFESDYEFVVNWNFNKMMDWFKRQNIYYSEIKTSLPVDVNVYANEKGTNYIVTSKNKLIEIIGVEEESNKEDILYIVYNKVFKEETEEKS
ncbi:MAG: DUF2812 domain-containing protein [Clostridium sp.]|uniref:DUF2812 domain-containing protein n=1 Tax=Clostridium sp. TaxID=1506 RepID=UPI0025C0F207|nr:DUF2812 domain-containing protein [Clostridium sp.]MCF0148332.1 DUF2812 domain-containing protein [Clostridium sp.]